MQRETTLNQLFVYMFNSILRRYALFVIFCMATILTYASDWKLQGNLYQVDTLYMHQLRTGISEGALKLSGPSNIRLFYTCIDLQTPGLGIVPFKGRTGDKGLEAISQSMHEKGNYVLGVNADFFSWEFLQPLGAMMVDGNLICSEMQDNYSYIVVDKEGRPSLSECTGTRNMVIAGNDTINLSAVNRSPKATTGLVLLTSAHLFSSDEATLPLLILKPAKDQRLAINQGIPCRIVRYEERGCASVPEGCFALRGNESTASVLQRLAETKKLNVKVEMMMDNVSVTGISQLVAGKPMLLRDGKVLSTNNVLSHLPELHPRTAVGISADGRYMTFVVVDGRSRISAGMTSYQLADAMRELGCSTALNLDGGGSSELYILEKGVSNVPSDGYERAVANGVGVTVSE